MVAVPPTTCHRRRRRSEPDEGLGVSLIILEVGRVQFLALIVFAAYDGSVAYRTQEVTHAQG